MKSLAVKYRPMDFDDVCWQDNIIRVLTNQLELNEIKSGYLFCGSAGTGKTTCARIFAEKINKGKAKPIEVDGASNNSVENVRRIIKDCYVKSLMSDHKVYIIDECHMLSANAWNAFLKVLEEPPTGVVFILCTTDPQKIPATILSRLQRFDFKRIPNKVIFDRLAYIIDQENKEILINNGASKDIVVNYNLAEQKGIQLITYDNTALMYIAKLASGGMRDGITKLNTLLDYDYNVNMENVLNCLGIAPYNTMYDLFLALYDSKANDVIEICNKLYMEGKDMKLFLTEFYKFLVDIGIYYYSRKDNLINIPDDIINEIHFEDIDMNSILYFIEEINKLSIEIRYSDTPLSIIIGGLMILCTK